MRWLLYGNLTLAVGEALVRHGHKVVPELIPEGASPGDVLKLAREKQLDIVTADEALARTPYETGPVFGRSIVFLQLEGGPVEQDDAIDRLFERFKRLSPGRLYTVTATQVKVRQLPARRT